MCYFFSSAIQCLLWKIEPKNNQSKREEKSIYLSSSTTTTTTATTTVFYCLIGVCLAVATISISSISTQIAQNNFLSDAISRKKELDANFDAKIRIEPNFYRRPPRSQRNAFLVSVGRRKKEIQKPCFCRPGTGSGLSSIYRAFIWARRKETQYLEEPKA